MDSVATIILAISLIIIMFGMGLSLQLADFKRILTYPKAMIVGLLNQLVLLPIIGYVLISMFSVQPEIAIGIMILAACPGGPTSNLITHLAKGDTALSVSLTAVNSIITIFTIPLIVNFALIKFMSAGQIIQLDIPKTILQIFVIVIIPVGIGMLIHRYNESFAKKMAKPVRIASGIVLALVIIGIIIKEKDNVIPYFKQAGLLALTLNVLSMVIGFYTAKLFKISRKQAVSISIESGIQNGTMAISIATVLLARPDFAIAPAIYSLIMFFTGGIIIFYHLRRQKHH
jgi:BASS family bile acid:Na+ symporter